MSEKDSLDSFPNLSKHQELREELSHGLAAREFTKGDVLVREGDFVAYVPLVKKGLVKVYKEDLEGNEILLYYIEQGESCIMSASSCLKENPSKIKAIIEEDAEVILIPAAKFQEYGRKFSGWNEFYWALFQSKYEELIQVISILTFSNKDTLLWEYLKKEAQKKGTRTLITTHQHIADDLGSTREVASRLLKKLEKEGKLQLGHGKIQLLGD